MASADVLHVGKFRVQHLVVSWSQRHPPYLFAGRISCGADALRKLVVVGEQACVIRAERNQNGACERRQIDHELRIVHGLDAPQHVRQHKAPLCVCVDDLYGLSGHGRHDVAGPLGLAVRHVFNEADGADDVDLRLACGQRMHEPDDAGGARHVALHVLHAACRLDGDAAGVERHALADEGDGAGAPSFGVFGLGAFARLGTLQSVPVHHHHTAFMRRALPYAQKRVHAKLLHRLNVENFNDDAELLQSLRALGEFFRIQNIGGLVHKIAGDVDALGDGLARFDGKPGAGEIAQGDAGGQSAVGVRIVVLLRLVKVKTIGAHPHAQRQIGRCFSQRLGRLWKVEHHVCRAFGAELAHQIAADGDMIGGSWRVGPLFGRAAQYKQAISVDPDRRPEFERRRGLALEAGGLRCPGNSLNTIAQKFGRRFAHRKVRACEHHERMRGRDGFLALRRPAHILEGDKFYG